MSACDITGLYPTAFDQIIFIVLFFSHDINYSFIVYLYKYIILIMVTFEGGGEGGGSLILFCRRTEITLQAADDVKKHR